MILRNHILELVFILQLFLEKSKSSMVPEEIVQDLYSKYKEAVLDVKLNSSSRRLFRRNKQYEIHVKKLKEVNGFKRHNLMIKEYKENLRTGDNRTINDPFIYINNPVESKIPKSFLTLQEFKEVLTNRVKLQRNELTTKQFLKLSNKTKKTTSRVKHKKNLDKNQSKLVSEKFENMSNLTKKLKPANGTIIVKNITVKYKNNVTNKIPTRFETIVTNKPMKSINKSLKLGRTNKFINVLKERTTIEMESIKTNEFKFRSENEMQNVDVRAEVPKHDSIYLATNITKTEIDNITSQVTTISDNDRISKISDSLNENKLINNTEKQANKQTFTVIFNSKTEEEWTTQTNFRIMTSIKTNKSQLKSENQMNNLNLRADEPKNESIHLSLTINKTIMDNTSEVTPISHDDRTLINTDLYNEQEVIKYTEKQLSDTVTTIFKSKFEEESSTQANVRSIITLKTNELTSANNVRPESPENNDIKFSRTLNKTLIDNNNKIEAVTITKDRTFMIADLLNENELKNSTEKELNDTFTNSKTEEESTIKNLITVSPEISSKDYETEPTSDTTSTNVVTEKTTITEMEVSTIQVKRKTTKPKQRATTQKVSIQIPSKRSTLGRPLVFMGSR